MKHAAVQISLPDDDAAAPNPPSCQVSVLQHHVTVPPCLQPTLLVPSTLSLSAASLFSGSLALSIEINKFFFYLFLSIEWNHSSSGYEFAVAVSADLLQL